MLRHAWPCSLVDDVIQFCPNTDATGDPNGDNNLFYISMKRAQLEPKRRTLRRKPPIHVSGGR
jgi:hypothetical protein